MQLHLIKTDRAWEKVQAKWTDKCGLYRAMLKQLADLQLLQGPEYDYLKLEDVAVMEAKVLPQGPLRGRKFVLEGTFVSSSRQALCEEIERYGGRIIRLEEIDGSDVIIVLGESDGKFVPPIVHYWGGLTSEMQLKEILQACANPEAQCNAATDARRGEPGPPLLASTIRSHVSSLAGLKRKAEQPLGPTVKTPI